MREDSKTRKPIALPTIPLPSQTLQNDLDELVKKHERTLIAAMRNNPAPWWRPFKRRRQQQVITQMEAGDFGTGSHWSDQMISRDVAMSSMRRGSR